MASATSEVTATPPERINSNLTQLEDQLSRELGAINLTPVDYLTNLTRTLNKTLVRTKDAGTGGGGAGRPDEDDEVEVSEGIVWTVVAPLSLLGLLLVLVVLATFLWKFKDRKCGRGDNESEADASDHGEMEMKEIREDQLRGAGPGHAHRLQFHPMGRGDPGGFSTRPRHGAGAAGEENNGKSLAPDCHYPHSHPNHRPPQLQRGPDTAAGDPKKKTKEIHLKDLDQRTPATIKTAAGHHVGAHFEFRPDVAEKKKKASLGLGTLHKPSLEDLARLQLGGGGLVAQDGRVWVSEEGLQGSGRGGGVGGDGGGVRGVDGYCSVCQSQASTPLPRGGIKGGYPLHHPPGNTPHHSHALQPSLCFHYNNNDDDDGLQWKDGMARQKCGQCNSSSTPQYSSYPSHYQRQQQQQQESYHHLRSSHPHPIHHHHHNNNLLQARTFISQSQDAHLHLGHHHQHHAGGDVNVHGSKQASHRHNDYQQHRQQHHHHHQQRRRLFNVSQSVDDHLHLLPRHPHPTPLPRRFIPAEEDTEDGTQLAKNHPHPQQHPSNSHSQNLTGAEQNTDSIDSNNPYPAEYPEEDRLHHQHQHHNHNRRAILHHDDDHHQDVNNFPDPDRPRPRQPIAVETTSGGHHAGRGSGSGGGRRRQRRRDSRRGVENPLFVADPDDQVADLGAAKAGAWDSGGRGASSSGGGGRRGSGEEERERRGSGWRRKGRRGSRRRRSGRGQEEAEADDEQLQRGEDAEEVEVDQEGEVLLEGESGTCIINSTSMLSPSDAGDTDPEHQRGQGPRANPAPLTRKPIVAGPDVSSIKLLNSTSQAWRASRRLLPSSTFSSAEETPSYDNNNTNRNNISNDSHRSNPNPNNASADNANDSVVSSATTNDDQSDEDNEDTLSLPSSISRFHASRVQFPPLMPDAVYPLTSTKALFSPSTAYHQHENKGHPGGDDTLENFSDNTSMAPNVGSSVTSGHVSDNRADSHNASSAGSDRFLNRSTTAGFPTTPAAAAAGFESRARGSTLPSGPQGQPDPQLPSAAGDVATRRSSEATSSDEAEGPEGRRRRRKRSRASAGTHPSRTSGKRSASTTQSVARVFAAAYNENVTYVHDNDNEVEAGGGGSGGDLDFTDPYLRALTGSERSEPSSPLIPYSASEMKHKSWNNLSHSRQATRPSGASGGKQGFFLIPKQSSPGRGGGYTYKYHKAPQVPTDEALDDQTRPGQMVIPTRTYRQNVDERTWNQVSPEQEQRPHQAGVKPHHLGPTPSFPTTQTPGSRLQEEPTGGGIGAARGDAEGWTGKEQHPAKLYSCKLPATKSPPLLLQLQLQQQQQQKAILSLTRPYQPSPRRSLGPNLLNYTGSTTGSEDKMAVLEKKSDSLRREAAGSWSGGQAARHRRGAEATQDLTPLLAPNSSPPLHAILDAVDDDDVQPFEHAAVGIAGSGNSSRRSTHRRNSRLEMQERGRSHEDYSYLNVGGNFFDDSAWTGRGQVEGSRVEAGRPVEESALKRAGLVFDRPSRQSDSDAPSVASPLLTPPNSSQRRADVRKETHGGNPQGDGEGNKQAPAVSRRLSISRTDSEILAEVWNSFPYNPSSNDLSLQTQQLQQHQPHPDGRPSQSPLYNVTIPTAFADELFGIWTLSPEMDDLSPSQPRTPLMTPLKKEAIKANAKFIWGSSGSPSTSNSSFAPGWLEAEDASAHVVIRRQARYNGEEEGDYIRMSKGDSSNTTTNSTTNNESSSSAVISVSDPTSSKEVEAVPDLKKQGADLPLLGGDYENDDNDDLEHDSNYKGLLLHLDNRSVSHLYFISGDPDNDDLNNNPANMALSTTSAPASPVKVVDRTGSSNNLDPSRLSAPPSFARALDEKKYWL